ncbi:hypothetical protein BBW65_00255 [Helicobacter enhydrae]|uniref:Beta-lactamase n=2 Tax=Helicobacter enhydrae TaxID=222136 RepID=A0A1B1U3L1_9HELI|nr:hypothetical protein BBW65_00255 [Helicobacter enhydrae]
MQSIANHYRNPSSETFAKSSKFHSTHTSNAFPYKSQSQKNPKNQFAHTHIFWLESPKNFQERQKMKKIVMLCLLLNAFLFVGCGNNTKNLEKECESGNMESCNDLGTIYVEGREVKQDFTKAVQLYEKACGGGDTWSCFGLGAMYYDGKVVKREFAKVRQLFEKACEGGFAVGCVHLGDMYENGEGVRQNLSTAKELYGKACDLGYQDGCDDYKKLNARGVQ